MIFSVAVEVPGKHQHDSQWIRDEQATQEKTAFFQAYSAHTTDPDLRLIYCTVSLEELKRQITRALQDVTAPDATGIHNARAAIAYQSFLTDLQTWSNTKEKEGNN